MDFLENTCCGMERGEKSQYSGPGAVDFLADAEILMPIPWYIAPGNEGLLIHEKKMAN